MAPAGSNVSLSPTFSAWSSVLPPATTYPRSALAVQGPGGASWAARGAATRASRAAGTRRRRGSGMAGLLGWWHGREAAVVASRCRAPALASVPVATEEALEPGVVLPLALLERAADPADLRAEAGGHALVERVHLPGGGGERLGEPPELELGGGGVEDEFDQPLHRAPGERGGRAGGAGHEAAPRQ